MKCAISSLAWGEHEREAVYHLMVEHGIAGLEIVPGMFFYGEQDPYQPSEPSRSACVSQAESLGLKLVSMQSLLFGKDDAYLFGTELQQESFVNEMKVAIDLASSLKIPNIVFGSPGNRKYSKVWAEHNALDHAAEIFDILGVYAANKAVTIAIEPNPAAYGTNFLNNVTATTNFVRLVASSAVKLNFDIGAISMNGDIARLESLFESSFDVISHIHMSEPNLAPAPADSDIVLRVRKLVTELEYSHWVSIEMKKPQENVLEEITRCIELFCQ
jgi:sugar phosphate isomerase/epimerase